MTDIRRTFMWVAPPMWKMRLVMHPSLQMSMRDLRDITLREVVELHVMLDLADEMSAEHSVDAERQARMRRM